MFKQTKKPIQQRVSSFNFPLSSKMRVCAGVENNFVNLILKFIFFDLIRHNPHTHTHNDGGKFMQTHTSAHMNFYFFDDEKEGFYNL